MLQSEAVIILLSSLASKSKQIVVLKSKQI